jgi:drug/metabolite transporter (DMT)-like permease
MKVLSKFTIFLILLMIGLIEMKGFILMKERKSTISYCCGLAIYIIVGIVLGEVIARNGLAKTHAMFDIILVILASIIGYFILGEKISMYQKIGIFFGVISIILICCE